MLIPWHTISVLAKCQSLKLECEHTLTKEVLAPPLDYSSQEISYRWVLPISPVRLKKNMNWHCQWGAKIISPMKAKHLALLPTLQLCHIMSLQCPDHTHFTPQSSLMTEKSFRNLMVSLTYIYSTPPLATARLMVTAGHCMPQEPNGWTQWVRRGDGVQRGRWKITASSSPMAPSCS